jgi:hypothetical protein
MLLWCPAAAVQPHPSCSKRHATACPCCLYFTPAACCTPLLLPTWPSPLQRVGPTVSWPAKPSIQVAQSAVVQETACNSGACSDL